ncbi:universal stress protein family-domain-containing protein [Blastocladiella britannica]|nr:universal stress protein family-domain-containing protein [Blastocladiella britannica]
MAKRRSEKLPPTPVRRPRPRHRWPPGSDAGSLCSEWTTRMLHRFVCFPFTNIRSSQHEKQQQVCLSWALRQLIHPERDHLVVLHVAPFKVAGLLGRNEEKTAKREIKAEGRAQRILDYAAAHVGQFVSELHVPLSFELVSLKAANQDVRDVVLDYVHDVSATMLLLGSHSGGSLKRAVLGSTATYCLNHAAIPVIIVNEQGGVKAG